MAKRSRLFGDRSPESVSDRYFDRVRPKLYAEYGNHAQYGTRTGRSLAEHLDSACQFVITVSQIAGVPEEKRSCIVAATAVHDLNKLDSEGRRVQTLARDRAFLQDQLEKACVAEFVKTDEDLELVRRLIERHSGHNTTDGARFLPEDPNIKRWAAMLIGADLFDLGIEKEKRIRKVENELTVALSRPTQLFEITLSEDRGYLTALLLSACEEILHQRGLHTLAINPDGQIFVGESFPSEDLAPEIAQRWQKQIDRIFGSNVEQLVRATKDGIKINDQAIQQNPDGAIEQVDALLAKKFSSYKRDKLAKDIQKYASSAGEEAVKAAEKLGLHPVDNAEEFSLSEGMKAAYLSYRETGVSPKDAWDKIAVHLNISPEHRLALEPFNAQYGRSIFAAQAANDRGLEQGLERIKEALRDSFESRKTEDAGVSEELVNAVRRSLNLSQSTNWQGFSELNAYIEANPRQRCSLGMTSTQVKELISNQMPPGTKVQAFSNRLPGGMSAEPKRKGDDLASLGYQLMTVGSSFPKSSKNDPLYLHFSLPQGSSPELKGLWRMWLRDNAAINTEGGTITFDELKLYRDNETVFKANKVVGAALPKRPEFIQSTVIIPTVWGEANSSLALLKALRLALEISLAPDFGFPFILGGNLEIESNWDAFGRVEGISSSLQPLLMEKKVSELADEDKNSSSQLSLQTGQYYREGQLSEKQRQKVVTAEEVLKRLQCIGKLAVSVASLQKKDDCLYDLARAAIRPLSFYHVLLRWVLREQDEPNLEATWNRIQEPLNCLLRSLMSEEHDRISDYLKKAARLAKVNGLHGRSWNRTAQVEPFAEFIKAVRSRKSHLDWDTVFASLVQQYHTRLKRINNYTIGEKKYAQIKEFYQVIRQLFEEVYNARPERLLSDSKTLSAAYLFFLQEAGQELKAQSTNQSEEN